MGRLTRQDAARGTFARTLRLGRVRLSLVAVLAGGVALTALTSSAVATAAAPKVRVLMAAGGNGNRMTVSPSTVKAGMVTFVITNQSNIPKKVNGIVQGSEVTRFVLLKTNLAPDKLPLTAPGMRPNAVVSAVRSSLLRARPGRSRST